MFAGRRGLLDGKSFPREPNPKGRVERKKKRKSKPADNGQKFDGDIEQPIKRDQVIDHPAKISDAKRSGSIEAARAEKGQAGSDPGESGDFEFWKCQSQKHAREQCKCITKNAF